MFVYKLRVCFYVFANQEEENPSLPYTFFAGAGLHSVEIRSSLGESLRDVAVQRGTPLPTEGAIDILCVPQAIFRVRPVTRCSADLEGHTEAVVALQFSPDGSCARVLTAQCLLLFQLFLFALCLQSLGHSFC